MRNTPINLRIREFLQKNPGKPMSRPDIAKGTELTDEQVRQPIHAMVRLGYLISKTKPGVRTGSMAWYVLASDHEGRFILTGQRVTPPKVRQSVFATPAWTPPKAIYRPVYDAPDCVIREGITKEVLYSP